MNRSFTFTACTAGAMLLLASCHMPFKTFPPPRRYPAPAATPMEPRPRSVRGEYISATYKGLQKGLNEAEVKLLHDSIQVLFPKNLIFGSGKSGLTNDTKPALYQFARLLDRYNKTNILIIGHTDSLGQPQRNILLSKRRADTTRAALYGMGVSPQTRLDAWGVGDREPVAPNATEEGRALNRCVEFIVLVSF